MDLLTDSSGESLRYWKPDRSKRQGSATFSFVFRELAFSLVKYGRVLLRFGCTMVLTITWLFTAYRYWLYAPQAEQRLPLRLHSAQGSKSLEFALVNGARLIARAQGS